MTYQHSGFMKGFAVVQILVLTGALLSSAFLPFIAYADQDDQGQDHQLHQDNQSNHDHDGNHDGDNHDGDHNGDNHDGDHDHGHDSDHHDGDNHDGDNTDGDDNQTPPPAPPATITVTATAIVCDPEAILPNWGMGGGPITATTAADYILGHLGCHLQSGWSFEYGNQDTANAGDTLVGPAGNGYTTFGPTDVNGNATAVVGLTGVSQLHLREVLQTGFIPFTQSTTNSDVSAEFYCADDAVNYNNYDFINNPVAGNSYNCIGFNAAVVVPPPQAACADGTDNDTDGLIDQADPGCHSDGNAGNSESYVAGDTDETNAPADTTSGGTGGGSGSNDPAPQTQSNTGGNGPVVGGNGPISGSFGGSGGGSVLGASTTNLPELPASCTALLHTYMRIGRKNNDVDEVKKLQQFLNDHMGAHLSVNGFFGKDTDGAVRAFQKKYEPQVLTPWGIGESTGYVFKTTQRWINMVNCASLDIPMPQL